MRKEKAPMTGREDCSAGTFNSTATRKHQSRAMQWEADATGKEHKQALYVLLSCKGGAA